jgi:long-chain fatty acid transport protein
MTELGRGQIDAGVQGIFIDAKTTNTGSTIRGPGTGGLTLPISGGSGKNPAEPVGLPHLSAAFNVVPNQLWLGLSLNTTYGLKTSYDGTWFGRYDSTYSDLKTYSFQPTAAWKVNEWFSVGVGAVLRYSKAELRTTLPNPLTPGGSTPATDGDFKLKGDDFAGGFNIGVLFKPTPQLNIGIDYQHSVGSTLRGNATIKDLRLPAAIPVAPGVFVPLPNLNSVRPAAADVTTPNMLAVGVSYQMTPQWKLLADVKWTKWDTFKDITIVALDNNTVINSLPQNYENTWTVAGGAEYRFSDALTFRGGLQYDQTPTNDIDRSTRVPDGDRLWTAVGASYNMTSNLSLDLSYAHIFVKSEEVNVTRAYYTGTPLATITNTRAHVEPSIDIVSVGARYRF